MADVRTFQLIQYIGVGLAADRPATPEREHVAWFARDTGAFSLYVGGAWVALTGASDVDFLVNQVFS